MRVKKWKVKMVRKLTNKVSPDVICESSFQYTLPADWGDMLNGLEQVDSAYHDSVFEGIQKHLQKKFAADGFFGLDLISFEDSE